MLLCVVDANFVYYVVYITQVMQHSRVRVKDAHT
jgi:hypothetical protein